jgi:dipeptidyl aminopeptidase/acylaminoacyl peptidase
MRFAWAVCAFLSASTIASAREAAPAAAPAQAASATAPVAAPLPGERLPVSAFAALPFIEMAALSPDGTQFAGLVGVNGAQSITMFSLFGGLKDAVRIRIPDLTEVDSVAWVNDANIIVRLRVLTSVEGDQWYVTRLIAVNKQTGKITKLKWDLNGQNGADVLWKAPDGSNEILLAGQDSIYTDDAFWPKIYRVDVTNGRWKQDQDGRAGVMNWAADSSGRVRVGVSYDDSSRSFKLLYRPADKSASFHIVDRADTRKRESLTSPFMFLPGSDNALVVEEDDKGKGAIFEYDLAKGARVKAVFSARTGGVSGAITSDDQTSLLGALTSDPYHPIQWIDPQLATIQAQFDKAVTDASASIDSLSRDRQKMLVHIGAPDMPGAYYYYNTAVGTLQRVAFVNEQMRLRHLAPVKLIQYNARDGLQIEAVLTLPVGKEQAKNLPLIVLPHGGPWANDTLRYDYWAQFLANRGYAVVQPNFRGSTGYGTEFERKGEGQMGLAMQDDVSDAVKWATSTGLADARRVCIMGASYGGYAAMWGIVKDPDQYRCAISIAGVADLRREVNDFGRDLQGNKFTDDWKRMTPDFQAVSPIKFVEQIKTPLLLIHGKKDVTVAHKNSSAMYDRMTKAQKTVEFVSMPLADHYYTRQEDRVKLLSAIEAFLSKYNPS